MDSLKIIMTTLEKLAEQTSHTSYADLSEKSAVVI